MIAEYWTDLAACRAVDPDLFFPVSAAGPALVQIAQAKRVCFDCPVTSECLAWALRIGEPAGVWGGTTPDERRYLRMKRPIATPGTDTENKRLEAKSAPGPGSARPRGST